MAESMKIEIIPLNHRLVTDIIPVIQPLVSEGGTVTGTNNKLIVKTTPSNLKQIKAVLAQIDNRPRSLMISVKQDIDGNFSASESGLSARYESDDLRIKSPDIGRAGTIVEGTDEDGNVIRYRQLETRSDIEDRNVFKVQTVEGNPAFIDTGRSVPIPTTTTYTGPGGVFIQDGIEYRDVTSGFYVLPRLQGDNVTLLVSPYLSRVNPYQQDSFDVQNVETTATGRLGQWIRVGGAAQSFSDDGSVNTISTKRRGQELRTMLIKVDEVE